MANDSLHFNTLIFFTVFVAPAVVADVIAFIAAETNTKIIQTLPPAPAEAAIAVFTALARCSTVWGDRTKRFREVYQRYTGLMMYMTSKMAL